MAKSKKGLSLNPLPLCSPTTFYYSLTNINDIDDQIVTKKPKRTLSKLDVGYESEDEINQQNSSIQNTQAQFSMKKSHSDYHLTGIKKLVWSSSLNHSLPLFKRQNGVRNWWRHSITSAYDTCSNPDIDFSIEEKKKNRNRTSLLMYSKKYMKFNRVKNSSQQCSSTQTEKSPNLKYQPSPVHPTSNSYDASAEYTDPEQSENDVDILLSDFNPASPVHQQTKCKSRFYNRYTTMTTTTGYSSDIELETTTTPSDIEDQQTPNLGKNTTDMKFYFIH